MKRSPKDRERYKASADYLRRVRRRYIRACRKHVDAADTDGARDAVVDRMVDRLFDSGVYASGPTRCARSVRYSILRHWARDDNMVGNCRWYRWLEQNRWAIYQWRSCLRRKLEVVA